MADLDRDFRAHTRERLAGRADDFDVDLSAYRDVDAARAAVAQRPNEPAAHAALAASLLVAGEREEAMAEVRTALRADRRQPLARYVGARLAIARRDTRTARADLRLLIEGGHDGYEVRILQARVALAGRDVAAARAALEAAAVIDPTRPDAWESLLEIAEQTRDEALHFRALRALVDVDQHDRARNYELMQALAERGDWDGVLEYGQRSVYVDPLRADARRLYSEALLRHDRPADALLEADAALAREPEQPGPAHLTRARALMALRRASDAARAAAAAVAADPSLAAEAQAVTRGRAR